MLDHTLIFSIFLIFTGAAILASLALFARQSLLVAYILLGGLVGPWGLQLVNDASVIQQIGHIGIIFLLFLLGLNLQPSQLLHMFREALVITVVSSVIFYRAEAAPDHRPAPPACRSGHDQYPAATGHNRHRYFAVPRRLLLSRHRVATGWQTGRGGAAAGHCRLCLRTLRSTAADDAL
jgi:hypothetical protein